MKKHLLLIILIISFSVFAKNNRSVASADHPYDNITIISDLDDTIKITHVGNIPGMIINGIFKERFFAGVSEFYQAIVSPRQTFYVLSGSPKILRPIIEDALFDNHMPSVDVILKSRKDGKTYDYKIKKLREIITTTEGKFILFGDDTEFDPQVLSTIKKEFPDRVLEIYIRSIRGKKFETPIKSYLTVYEVAYEEEKANRLEESVLFEIETAILNSKDKLIIPSFVSCALLPDLKKKMSAAIERKISEICLRKK